MASDASDPFHIEMGRYFVSQVLVFGVHLLEMPVVILGRSQGWPIEKGGAAFIIFDLSTVGYSLVFLGWTLVGILVGGLIGLTRKMINRRRNPAEENRAGEVI